MSAASPDSSPALPPTGLQNRLHADMVAAMKSGDKERLSVIRMMLSDVKNADLMPGKPSAETLVAAYAKKLRKSLEEYDRLGRSEEVAKLRQEIAVADSYLPAKASAEETDALVATFLSHNSFTEKQAGQATGAFMKANAGKVDPAAASTAIRKHLAGK